ncbi:MAG: hypothetical protein ACLTA5_02320 [Anaerococcus obesiensis]
MKKRISYKLLLISIIIGLCAGLVVSLFRLLIPKVMFVISNLIILVKNLLNAIIFVCIYIYWFFGLICVNKEPMIGGREFLKFLVN